MNTNRALAIATTLMALTSLEPSAYADSNPVTASECENGGGVVFTDTNGFQACDGGTFHGRSVV